MYKYLKGGVSSDFRGKIKYVNEFDMKKVKRFYIINNSEIEIVRGWRAHRIECRWFYPIVGSFKIFLVKIDNWTLPNPHLNIEELLLDSKENKVLFIPSGYGVAFQMLENNSEVLVFADHYLEHSSKDDFIFPLDYFKNIKL